MVLLTGIIENALLQNTYTIHRRKTQTRFLYSRHQYRTQVQFNLMVTQRKWCDFVYYHPRGGIRVQRIERDEEYIKKIETALDDCIIKIKEML